MKREFSAGGIVFKKKDNSIFWLIAKSAPSKLYPKSVWRLPKGWLDDKNGGKNPGPLATGARKATEKILREAALKEVREEGGVEAKIIEKLGTDKYFYTQKSVKILKFVTFYLMEWLADLPDGPDFETEKVAWLLFEKARKKLEYPREKKTLDKASLLLRNKAKKALDQGVQTNLI
jgi:8-oxo-dGTP pyrophosphatase MutT (NUDIX family)